MPTPIQNSMGERKGSGFLDAYSRKSYKNSDRRYTKDPETDSNMSSLAQISSKLSRVQNHTRYQAQTNENATADEETFRSRRMIGRQPDEQLYSRDNKQREARSVLSNEFYSRKPFNYKTFGAK